MDPVNKRRHFDLGPMGEIKEENEATRPYRPPVGDGALSYGHTTYPRYLGTKQNAASLTAQPTHTSDVTECTEIVLRADAVTTFATSITANQPVATIFDRIRAYDAGGQYAEVEGRALPVSAYHLAYLRYGMHHQIQTPGHDVAVPNTTQTYALYRTIGMVGKRKNVSVQDVVKSSPFAGSGAQSAYSSNDGAGGEYDDTESAIGKFFVARSYGSGISSIKIKQCKAFMIASANDINSGFTIEAGGNTYVLEEINDAEERIADFLGTAAQSITGTAGAALRSARGTPEDPFTGALVYLFSDHFSKAKTVSVTMNTAQAVQVSAISDDSIGAISTG